MFWSLPRCWLQLAQINNHEIPGSTNVEDELALNTESIYRTCFNGLGSTATCHFCSGSPKLKKFLIFMPLNLAGKLTKVFLSPFTFRSTVGGPSWPFWNLFEAKTKISFLVTWCCLVFFWPAHKFLLAYFC